MIYFVAVYFPKQYPLTETYGMRWPDSVSRQPLRIDNRRQSVICGILLSSLAIACTLKYYI